MVIQPATLKRADEHYFKLNFPGNLALLEKPLSLLEVEEAKENISPTFSPVDCRPSSPRPLLWWVDELWWSMFSTKALTNCLPRWMEKNTITLYLVNVQCQELCTWWVCLCSRWLCKTKFLFFFMVRQGTTTKLWVPGETPDEQH